ncbi:MAG: ABC transporter ATP-binding protein [Deltaproteobacteria bacterium]|jgi:branched-chain amino acid transport system ATP-binding protein|nr:ABC transporter ATP-binding protein [Deltaproteobacteria bacterium]
MSTVLTVKDLEVRYGGILALKGLSFEVKKGEIVSLIGANGAGKTTTLRAISGLVAFTGKIEFSSNDGNTLDLATIARHEIVRLGLAHAPEGRGIFPNLTVLENLSLGAFARNDKEAIAQDLEHCFELFPRLKERIRQKAGTLSGGEQQMVAISRAIMSKPSLLLLDEPSLGLAPLIVAQIFEIIKKLNSEGMTILLVEQNARMALKVSHRAYCVETGKITLSGTGKGLLNDPRIVESYLGGH